MIKQIGIIPSWFLIYFTIFPVIDVFNGWLISENNSLPLGVVYRLGLLAFCLFLLLKKHTIRFQKMFHLFMVNFLVLGGLLFIQSFFFSNSLAVILLDASSIVKYLQFFLVCMIFIEYEQNENIETLLLLCINGLLSIGLWIPYLLHIGNYTYQNSLTGFKGFYFATNDITYAFSMMLILTIFSFLQQYKTKKLYYPKLHLLLICLDISCITLITTKFGLIFMVCMIFYLVSSIFHKNIKMSIHTKVLVLYLFLIVLLAMILVGYKYVIASLSGLTTRIVYFYHFYDGNLINVITSSRSVYLQKAWNYFYTFPNNHYILWTGFGVAKRMALFGRAGNVEMDLFDTFFSFGAIGIILVIVTLTIISKWIDRSKKSYILFGITLVYSTFTGHVFYSGMSTMIFGYILAKLINQNKEFLTND